MWRILADELKDPLTVGQIIGINFLLGVSLLIGAVGDLWSARMVKFRQNEPGGTESAIDPTNVQGIPVSAPLVYQIRFGKCGIYFLLLLIARIAIPEGGPLFLQAFRVDVLTGLFGCAVGFFIAGCLPTRGNNKVLLDDGREIRTHKVTFIAWLFLMIGCVSILTGLSFALFPIAGEREPLMLFPCALIGVYLIIVFAGLRGFKNWARMMALLPAVLTVLVSWYVLWILFVSDARWLFVRKSAAKGTAATA